MTRDRSPRGVALDKTDPGAPPEPPLTEDVPAPTTEAEMLRAEQLIEAFKRPPRRPTPAYSERAQSEGGNAVGYQSTAQAAPGHRPPEEREKVLVQLAAAARTFPADSTDGRDVITVPIPRDAPTDAWDAKRRRQRVRNLAGGLLLLAVAAAILIPVARLGASDLAGSHRPPRTTAGTSATAKAAAPVETSAAPPASASGTSPPLSASISAPAVPLAPSAAVALPPKVLIPTSPWPPVAPAPVVPPRRSAESASAKVEPVRDRHSESAPASSPAPNGNLAPKDQFWE